METKEELKSELEEYKKVKANEEAVAKIYKTGEVATRILGIMCLILSAVFFILWLCDKGSADKIEICVLCFIVSGALLVLSHIKKRKRYPALEHLKEERFLREQKLVEMGIDENEL